MQVSLAVLGDASQLAITATDGSLRAAVVTASQYVTGAKIHKHSHRASNSDSHMLFHSASEILIEILLLV